MVILKGGDFGKLGFHEFTMLLNSVWLLNTQKSIPKRQLLVKGKSLLIRMLAIWGEDGVMSPQNQLPRFCSARKVLKGKGGLILVNH